MGKVPELSGGLLRSLVLRRDVYDGLMVSFIHVYLVYDLLSNGGGLFMFCMLINRK